MADELRMALAEVLRKAGVEQADFLREGVRVLAEELMEMELADHLGAERHERTTDRTGYRNGYRERPWDTRVGTIELQVPRVRDGSFFPSLLEPRRRAERALVAVVQEAYIQGVSTRRVDDLVQALGMQGISKSQVSRMCAELDGEVQRFRTRKLEGPYPYVWLDGTVRHEAPYHRAGGRTRQRSVAADRRSWRQSDPRGVGLGRSSLDDDETGRHCQMARARQARREGVSRSEPVVEPPQARTTSSNLADMGWPAVRADLEYRGLRLEGRWVVTVPRLWERTAAYPELGGRGKAGPRPRQSVCGERGNHCQAALASDDEPDEGQDRRRLMTRQWDGVLVVVGGRESRPQGEGGQRVRSGRVGTPGGRR